jgi:hypothetical protein
MYQDPNPPLVQAFLDEIKQVCLRHSITIEHQDDQGAFVLEVCNKESDVDWFMQANIGESLERAALSKAHPPKR